MWHVLTHFYNIFNHKPCFSCKKLQRRESSAHTMPNSEQTGSESEMYVMHEIFSKNMKQLDFSVLVRRANQIKEELKQGVKKPYRELIDVSWGDPHRTGVKPLSFVRQVLAGCVYPQLLESDRLKVDVRQRAQRLLETCAGGSVGSYSDTAGLTQTLKKVSEFITRRDGGVPSHPDSIYISPGSQWSLTNILNILVNPEASPKTGVLVPAPSHCGTTQSILDLGAEVLPYYLMEEQGWALQVEELQRAFDSAKGVCKPFALYIINPGNPAGGVQSRKSMQEVIEFVSEKKLFLLADEVYQECVYGENVEFLSYKRVLAEMEPPLSETVELASFHSASKSIIGECGLRTGYVELVNLDPSVLKLLDNLFSTNSCAPVLGQLALDLMINPPQPGDPSYPLFYEETQHIRTTLIQNVRQVFEVVNSLPGFSCQPVEGAFAFPSVHIPPKAIQKAKEVGMEPDTFYCIRLLEETGVLARSGSEFGQKDGTYHIRFCIMTAQHIMEELLRRLSIFHTKFMKEFS